MDILRSGHGELNIEDVDGRFAVTGNTVPHVAAASAHLYVDPCALHCNSTCT